jgi:hypothetical protein
MADGQTYSFSVNEDYSITPDEHNPQGVTWNSTTHGFDVSASHCQIQLMPGEGLKSIDKIELDWPYEDCPLTFANVENFVVLSDPNTSGDDRHWRFAILGTNDHNQPWRHDPKIYNDGSPHPRN